MSDGVVVPFRPAERPRVEDLVRHVRAMAAVGGDTTRVHFGHPHFQQQLAARGVTMRQVLETLREGSATQKEPTLDRYGDWRIKLRRLAAGRPVQVVVACKADHIVLVTVI